MPPPTSEQIERVKQRIEQGKARLEALEARASDAERKRDTRRKIVLGGLLLKAAEKEQQFADGVGILVKRVVRSQDLEVFKNWTPPTPALSD